MFSSPFFYPENYFYFKGTMNVLIKKLKEVNNDMHHMW